MGILKEKYEALAPRGEYLTDVVVLGQAWKKAHNYVRRHNWYQNSLELDCSAVALESSLKKWAAAVRRPNFRPAPLRMIPAPKSAAWDFSPEWSPKNKDSTEVLRPLAHLSIRDQTITTAAMLCLADCIETAQGNTDSEPDKARSDNVYSYGNRLYCRWSNDGPRSRARFSWGNSDVYSRYSQDYKRFIDRPISICSRLNADDSDAVIFVVKIDLSAFFDNIEIPELVSVLKREYRKFASSNTEVPRSDAKFWEYLTASLNFSWDSRDEGLSPLLRDRKMPGGLPQGMVASGFLANAYLLPFDRIVGSAVQTRRTIKKSIELQIHDYCRYVDDLRLVVSTHSHAVTEGSVAKAVEDWLQRRLARFAGSGARLHINTKKTEVERYSSIGGQSGVVARMQSMQKDLSGPFDMTTLTHVEAGLHGLLSQAELGLQAEKTEHRPLALSAIAIPKLEVRDDTLTRFSAFRLTKALRLRRTMTDLREVTADGTAREALLHEYEVAARRLVASWALNPSLVQVLLYALDLFPSVDLLGPVIEALRSKTDRASSTHEERVAWYVVSELLRAGATETGRRSESDADFGAGDLKLYRARLCNYAREICEAGTSPWYAKQQAILLLATEGQVSVVSDESALSQHAMLSDYIAGRFRSNKIRREEAVAVALVGYSILKDSKHFSSWMRTFAASVTTKEISRAFETIGQVDINLLFSITRTGKARQAAENGIVPRYLAQYLDSRLRREEELPVKVWIPLAEVLTHNTAPFSQENALLQLANALAKVFEAEEPMPRKVTPLSIEIWVDDWSRLVDPRAASLVARYRPRRFGPDPRYATPAWCQPRLDWLYAMGRILRAAASGELDFTANHWLLRNDVGWYHGIRSSWLKRRSGMSSSATTLGGTTAGFTPWMSEVLVRMLSWPGIAIDAPLETAMDRVLAPADFAAIVTARLEDQAKFYARALDLPVYIYPVAWSPHKERSLRVAVVQGLMPLVKDFENGIDGLKDASFRERHRNHLAAILQVAYKKIVARESALGVASKPAIDLVILPEYSVHVDDQDLMRQFSDAVGGMIFFGLIGASNPQDGSFVNAARWLVPQRRGGKRSWVEVDQGKGNLTKEEHVLGVKPWRPYQAVIELMIDEKTRFRLAGAICYDATDIRLAADLRDLSHAFVVPAMNRDVKTFDSMVSALRYHMYQHIVIANSGEFGGSTAQAPYDKEHSRLIAHSHGGEQLSVNVFDIDVDHFGPALKATEGIPPRGHEPGIRALGKTPPAGLSRS